MIPYLARRSSLTVGLMSIPSEKVTRRAWHLLRAPPERGRQLEHELRRLHITPGRIETQVVGFRVLRELRTVFGVAVVVFAAAPISRKATDDSFPFSTYPMFARVLAKPVLTFAEGVTDTGQVVRLAPELIANDEPMQAMRTLRLSANAGQRSLKSLCRSIASRVARSQSHAKVRRVRIQQGRFDPLTYFDGAAAPETTQLLVRCPVRDEG